MCFPFEVARLIIVRGRKDFDLGYLALCDRGARAVRVLLRSPLDILKIPIAGVERKALARGRFAASDQGGLVAAASGMNGLKAIRLPLAAWLSDAKTMAKAMVRAAR